MQPRILEASVGDKYVSNSIPLDGVKGGALIIEDATIGFYRLQISIDGIKWVDLKDVRTSLESAEIECTITKDVYMSIEDNKFIANYARLTSTNQLSDFTIKYILRE